MPVWIGIGGNRGRVASTLCQLIRRCQRDDRWRVVALSPWYWTEPVGVIHQPWFLNGILGLETCMRPRALLYALQRLEQRYGRCRQRERRWGPRPLDLDLLFYGTRILRTRNLTIPHPRMHRRRFVLHPLADLAPDYRHPKLEKNVANLLHVVTDPARIRPFRQSCGCHTPGMTLLPTSSTCC